MHFRLLWRRTALLLACLLSTGRAPAWGAEAKGRTETPAGQHVRLLAVGNSFSGNATRFLGDLVTASAGGNRRAVCHDIRHFCARVLVSITGQL